ncbi:hypothetical protein QYE76_020783 [Lolium multiflorum]|uniref:Uncharacterized protein n=1 Tax=Lolium multiflorum TaxID=4521 RepID=A0AAD8R768_LOLMU|nr:hypothetical protein QYE76_020783 [Lolium multiflorum]
MVQIGGFFLHKLRASQLDKHPDTQNIDCTEYFGDFFNGVIPMPQNSRAFSGHIGPVSCLAFGLDSPELFSGSYDSSIMQWNDDDRTSMHCLYSHQGEILTTDALSKDRLLTVARDRTMHLWKLKTLLGHWRGRRRQSASPPWLHVERDSGREQGAVRAARAGGEAGPVVPATLSRTHGLQRRRARAATECVFKQRRSAGGRRPAGVRRESLNHGDRQAQEARPNLLSTFFSV